MPVNPDFVSWMTTEVKTWADRYNCQDNRAFPAWALNFIFEVDDDDAFNQTDTLKRGDAGLDGWFFDKEGLVFHLIQAKYLANPIDSLVDPGDLDSLVKAADYLQSPEKVADGPHAEKLSAIAVALKEALDNDAAISLDYFIAGRVTDESKRILQDSLAAKSIPHSATFYDTEKLSELKLGEDTIQDLSGVQVEFDIASDEGYFDIQSSDLAGVEHAGVAVLDGRSIADAVDKWGPRLFHGNVRYYLRRSNRVNKGMLATLDSPDGRNAFWLYNNGITIVSDKFEFSKVDETWKLLATNPQIVNGAQTSSVLRERRAKLSIGDVAVQCRVIAVEDNDAGRTALEAISEFTNSQSPVKPADLRSNDKRHRTLQTAFGLLPSPVFYERRRGEWHSLSAAQKGQYAKRKVTKDEIGQHYLAFLGRPADSVTKKESIFGDLESLAFNTSVSAHVYMLAHDLFEQADSLLRASNAVTMIQFVPGFANPITDEPGAPSYLESIRRARALVCAHATALAHEVLKWRYSAIGQQRAHALRGALSDPTSVTYEFVWKSVFRAIRQWYANTPDKSALKVILQRGDTFTAIQAVLAELLTDSNKEQLPALNGDN